MTAPTPTQPEHPNATAPVGAWQDLAACRGMNPDMFYPPLQDGRGRIPQSEHRLQLARANEAKQICARCPVQPQCAEAGEFEQGLWGGQTERERREATG